MQTAVIADQNGRNNVGKTNCGNIELAFLVSAIKEGRTSRRRRLQVQLAFKNRRRFFNLVCLLLLLIPKGTSQLNCDESRIVHSCHRFLQDSFILSFSVKNTTRRTPPDCLPCNPLHSYRIQIRNTANRSGLCPSSKYIFCALEARGTHIFPLFPPFCSRRLKQAVYA